MISIHELFRQIREHSDYIGGAVFTQGDLPDNLDEDAREDAAIASHLEAHLSEAGNRYLDQEYKEES